MTGWMGVDVGGTFIDVVSYDENSQKLHIAKVMNSGGSVARGVIEAIRETSAGTPISNVQFFVHGTTIGLNTVLERTGATVGMLCTKGFRDVLELRRSKRDEMYDLFWRPPTPLVPRWLRLPVTERMAADGTVITPLVDEDVGRALKAFSAEGVDAIAVAFINAYANPAHELQVEMVLRSLGFDGPISLSHRVSSEYREYERTATCVVDAYVRARVVSYLEELENALEDAGFRGQFLVTRSGGGSMTVVEAKDRPFETMQSGPVAGVVGSSRICQILQIDEAITADIGGTSFDTSLIVGAKPTVKYEGSVDSLPIQAPWIDVRSVGAGGGSIAWLDPGGLLRVGPMSAGARPGPSCYGLGGKEPTVTDAAVVLGMLGHVPLAGGLELDHSLALNAIGSIASRLGVDPQSAAKGVITIMVAGMANAIREVTIETGHDPRDAALIAYGGAGPLFCTLLCRELEIARVLIPPHPGNFSAWGLLAQDLMRTYSASLVAPLTSQSLEKATAVSRVLFDRLLKVHSDFAHNHPIKEVALDLRYAGQEYTLTIPVRTEEGGIIDTDKDIAEAFRSEYERVYGNRLNAPLQVVATRSTLRIPLSVSSRQPASGRLDSAVGDSPSRVQAFSFSKREFGSFALVSRQTLHSQKTISGPAIVYEPTATTYLDAGFTAALDASGCIIVERRE